MISGLICYPLWDRIAALTFTFYMLCVHQVNLRAVFKAFNGIVSVSSNDTLLMLGLAGCLSLPLVPLFDEHEYKILHGLSAGIFFITSSIYQTWFITEVQKHQDKFPGMRAQISYMGGLKILGLISFFGFMFSMIL